MTILNSIIFHTKNLEKVKKFYQSTFDLKVGQYLKNGEMVPDESDSYVNFDLNGTLFCFEKTDKEIEIGTAVLHVKSLSVMKERLQLQNINFTGDGVRWIKINDPEGRSLIVEQIQNNSDQTEFFHLFELEKELHQFETRSNANRLSCLLSLDFLEYGSSGKVWTRDDILNRLQKEDGKIKIDSSDFHGRRLSENSILVTYLSRKLDSTGGTSEFLRSSIWQKIDGDWKMVFHQGTPKF